MTREPASSEAPSYVPAGWPDEYPGMTLCSRCGCLVPAGPEWQQQHTRWHVLVLTLAVGDRPRWWDHGQELSVRRWLRWAVLGHGE